MLILRTLCAIIVHMELYDTERAYEQFDAHKLRLSQIRDYLSWEQTQHLDDSEESLSIFTSDRWTKEIIDRIVKSGNNESLFSFFNASCFYPGEFSSYELSVLHFMLKNSHLFCKSEKDDDVKRVDLDLDVLSSRCENVYVFNRLLQQLNNYSRIVIDKEVENLKEFYRSMFFTGNENLELTLTIFVPRIQILSIGTDDSYRRHHVVQGLANIERIEKILVAQGKLEVI